jgi:transcriptional regulator with GAF, ATPase, and Fis domain
MSQAVKIAPIDDASRWGALLDEVVGARHGLREVMERIDLVRGSDVPVLLLGETGSGKEVVARALHAGSGRAQGPFIRVNCGAIAPELVDSQLFGHERGSFTGAVGQRKGWFERAHSGTLFLDEIGELSSAAQVRLLRVLQDGMIERVGGQDPVQVDCRIVAATHRNLERMVRDGSFREDLWYRLSVFPVAIPPLRERTCDIEALTAAFAERSTRFGLPPCRPTADDVRRLQAYPWPGNVRELAAVIDRAAILGRGRGLAIAQALGPVASEAPAAEATAPLDGDASLETVIRRHIEAVLRACEGRIEGPRGAAKVLRLNPATLRSKLRKLGISTDAFRGPGSPS